MFWHETASCITSSHNTLYGLLGTGSYSACPRSLYGLVIKYWVLMRTFACVRAGMHAFVRVYVRAVCACVHVCFHACVCACVRSQGKVGEKRLGLRWGGWGWSYTHYLVASLQIRSPVPAIQPGVNTLQGGEVVLKHTPNRQGGGEQVFVAPYFQLSAIQSTQNSAALIARQRTISIPSHLHWVVLRAPLIILNVRRSC